MPKKARGFSLVELLVVLSIISILSGVLFVSSKNFLDAQIAQKASSQIQTILRLAQSNATSNLKCQAAAGGSWSVKFVRADSTRVELNCDTSVSPIETLILENARVSTIKGSACSTNSFPDLNQDIIVKFSPLYGNVSFLEAGCAATSCSSTCTYQSDTLTITLRNVNTNSEKSLTISRGGAIDVK